MELLPSEILRKIILINQEFGMIKRVSKRFSELLDDTLWREIIINFDKLPDKVKDYWRYRKTASTIIEIFDEKVTGRNLIPNPYSILFPNFCSHRENPNLIKNSCRTIVRYVDGRVFLLEWIVNKDNTEYKETLLFEEALGMFPTREYVFILISESKVISLNCSYPTIGEVIILPFNLSTLYGLTNKYAIGNLTTGKSIIMNDSFEIIHEIPIASQIMNVNIGEKTLLSCSDKSIYIIDKNFEVEKQSISGVDAIFVDGKLLILR